MAEPLTAVRLVCDAYEQSIALPHVALKIDGFLWATGSQWTMETASRYGFLRLMNRRLKSDWPYYSREQREGRLYHAIKAAVCRGYDPLVVEWWFKTYMPDQDVLTMATVYKLAFRHTRLPALAWARQELKEDLPSPEYCESPDTAALLLSRGDYSCTRLSLHRRWESYATFQSIKRCFTYQDQHEDSFEIYGGEYAVDEALRCGLLADLKWLLQHRPQFFQPNHVASHRRNHDGACLLRNAIRYGNVDAAKWLASLSPELLFEDPRHTFEDSLDALHPFRYDLETLRWVLSQYVWRKPRNRSYWMCEARDYAARSGNMEMLEFVYKIRFQTAQAASKAMRRWGEAQVYPVMDDAAALGDLDVLLFFHGHRSRRYTARAMTDAAANGHLEVVQWLQEHRSKGSATEAIKAAAANGHHEIVQWLGQFI